MKSRDERSDRICKYCERSTEIPLTGNMLCPTKGIVSYDFVCSKFKYDPFKRIPKRARPDPEKLEFVSLEDAPEEE